MSHTERGAGEANHGQVTIVDSTRTRRRAAARFTAALKAAMAVSGLIMVLFLPVHMYGNLKLSLAQAAFDDYALHLRTIGEPYRELYS
jgi:succinate dehydrogenase / fumarate reductase cytochrome b subunit